MAKKPYTIVQLSEAELNQFSKSACGRPGLMTQENTQVRRWPGATATWVREVPEWTQAFLEGLRFVVIQK
jgi:hypothetical protein